MAAVVAGSQQGWPAVKYSIVCIRHARRTRQQVLPKTQLRLMHINFSLPFKPKHAGEHNNLA